MHPQSLAIGGSGRMMPTGLAAAYLALAPLAWPTLPLNIHVADLMFLALAVTVFREYRARWQMQPLDYCVIAYLLAFIPSFFATDDASVSGIELLKRSYLVLVYIVFAMYFRAEGHLAAFKVIVWATVAFCAAGLAAVLVYFVAHVEVPPLVVTTSTTPYLGPMIRLRSGTETPALFGNYLAFALPFLCAAGPAGLLRRRAWIASLCVAIAAMGWTFSHALTGFIASGLVMAWPALRRRYGGIFRVALVGTAILCVLAINFTLMWTVRRVDWRRDFDESVSALAAHPYELQSSQGASRLNVHVSYNPMSYYLLKKAAFKAFLDRPWTGVGLGQFRVVTLRAHEEGQLHESYRGSDPHSTLFGALAETGILGGLAFVFLVVLALLPAVRVGDPTARWFVVASRAAVFGLAVSSLNVDMMNFRFLWIGLAALHDPSSELA